MMPTVEQLADAIEAINAQQPSLTDAPRPEARWHNEQDGNGRRVLRLTPEQVATIATALGVATGVARCEKAWWKTTPEQTAWAGIIDVALTARGAPPGEMRSEAFAALTRVDVATLERMAALVLGDRRERGPDTPEELTRAVDMLLAEYLLEHPAALPSQTSVLALLEWNGARIRAAAAVEYEPDTPETAADKARAARDAMNAFRREVGQRGAL